MNQFLIDETQFYLKSIITVIFHSEENFGVIVHEYKRSVRHLRNVASRSLNTFGLNKLSWQTNWNAFYVTFSLRQACYFFHLHDSEI